MWGKSHALALNTIRVARRIRGSDHSALRLQIIRAVSSIPTNIVEGTGQDSGKEFGRFISIAIKSSSELEYHLVLARDLELITQSDFTSLSDQTIAVRRMLYALRTRMLASRAPKRSVPA